MSIRDTLDCLRDFNKSITRFGDGEFELIMSNSIPFQKYDDLLSSRLKEILKYDKSDLDILICIPFCDVESDFGKQFWLRNFEKLSPYFSSDLLYGNASISRLPAFFECSVDNFKELWDKRDVVFVTSTSGRMDMNHELFDNISTYSIIDIPAINAFDEYDFILEECLKQCSTSLFLLACGPTATILAFDLTKLGYHALDIGHLSNSYDQYLGKIFSPEKLPLVIKNQREN